jgi:hypothetical protein
VNRNSHSQLYPEESTSSNGHCSDKCQTEKRSEERTIEWEVSQDLLRESRKVLRGENHKDER